MVQYLPSSGSKYTLVETSCFQEETFPTGCKSCLTNFVFIKKMYLALPTHWKHHLLWYSKKEKIFWIAKSTKSCTVNPSNIWSMHEQVEQGLIWGKFVVDWNSHQELKPVFSLNFRSADSLMFAPISLRFTTHFNRTHYQSRVSCPLIVESQDGLGWKAFNDLIPSLCHGH